MKSLLKYASLLTMAIVTLTLTACGGQSFDITLENGSDIIIETGDIQITNQELFDMIEDQTGAGSPSLAIILEWADYILLSDLVDIDEDRVTERLEMLSDFFGEDEADIEQGLLTEGLDLDTYTTLVRVQVLREQVVEAAIEEIEFTSEEILEVYHEWFPEAAEENSELDEAANTDADVHTDELDTDSAIETDELETDFGNAFYFEDSIPSLEEMHDEIEAELRGRVAQDHAFEQETLANIRYHADFVIHSSYLTASYESLLESWEVEDVNVNDSNNHETAIATFGDHVLTVDELFDTVVARFALAGHSAVLRQIDLQLLEEAFDVSHNDIRRAISEEKVNRMEWFYPEMEMMGLTTERQIFNHFLFQHLQDAAFEANFEPDEARVQELYENHVPHRYVSHILVDSYEEATDLITQLQEVDEDEFADLFAELATEYSSCGSAHNGGSLGALTPPTDMVEEFEDAFLALNEGEFTETPVETIFGYHIIFVSDIGEPLTLDQHRENEMLNLRANTQLFNSFLIELRAENGLVFHHAALQAQYEAIVAQNAQDLEEDEFDFEDFDEDFDYDELEDFDEDDSDFETEEGTETE